MWIVFSWLSVTIAAQIYMCVGSDGHTTYADRPCHNALPYHPAKVTPYSAPLSSQELQQLRDLEKRHAKQSRQRQSRIRKHKQHWSKNKRKQQAECRAAKNNLRAIAKQRRKGYKLTELNNIDRAQARALTRIKANC